MQTRVFLAVALACALAIPVTAQIVVTPASPYFEDFELGGAGWSTAGTLWELGTPAQAAISAAFSGMNCFMTDLDANYPNGQSETVEATFDLTAMPYDPTLRFQLHYFTETFFDGVQVQVDTGAGFQTLGSFTDLNWYTQTSIAGLSGGDGWSGGNLGYQQVSHVLTGTAGTIATVRFLFGSDSSITSEGVAFDDVEIFLGAIPPVVLDPMNPYLEDFESGPGNWFPENQNPGVGSDWEYGTPSAASINMAASGTQAWAVDLDSPYANNSVAVLNGAFDATAFAVDPVFSLNIHYQSEFDWDGTFIEIDTGSGFTLLGDVGQGMNWYNSNPFNSQFPGWMGDSTGYVNAAITLTGTAGTIFQMRIVFLSDSSFVVGDGVAIDDISIDLPTSPYPGTGEDLQLTSSVNFAPLSGGNALTELKSVLVGDLVTLNLASPGGTFNLLPYALVATLFDASIAPVPSPMGGAYADANSVVVLGLGANDLSFGVGAILPPNGVGATFAVPPAFMGVDILFQGFSITSTGMANMFYASTNGHVIDG
ncbi:MAG: hypothetical protein KDB53_02160 [Planctomycetes bacterium]|nr:hypothetical protein [Planctomycetota bacterium]